MNNFVGLPCFLIVGVNSRVQLQINKFFGCSGANLSGTRNSFNVQPIQVFIAIYINTNMVCMMIIKQWQNKQGKNNQLKINESKRMRTLFDFQKQVCKFILKLMKNRLRNLFQQLIFTDLSYIIALTPSFFKAIKLQHTARIRTKSLS